MSDLNDQWGEFYHALFEDRAQLCALRDIWEALRNIKSYQFIGGLDKTATTAKVEFDNATDCAQFNSGCNRILTIASRERK